MAFPNLPKWWWWTISAVVLLILLAVLKVEFQIGSGGIHLQQHLVNK